MGGAHQESDPGPVPPLITPPTRVRYTPAVQAEIEEQERAAVQRSTVHLILSELLGLGAHLTVGRPSNSVKRRIAIRNTLESRSLRAGASVSARTRPGRLTPRRILLPVRISTLQATQSSRGRGLVTPSRTTQVCSSVEAYA